METKKVLVVDDVVHILSLMKRIVKRLDCDVDVATSGEEAVIVFCLALKNGVPYDLIIMDRDMPGKSGEVALMEIREYYPQVQAILHSGDTLSEVYNNYEKFGFVGVLDKPSDPDVIRAIVSSHL